MMDAYAPCPCGSGKKFKWCCQPLHGAIDKAIALDQEGQHEAGLRALEALTKEHPGNPEVWGQLAHMLYAGDRVEDAEKALQQALAINPNYPFGHVLRAQFRMYEGEIPGALIMLRKAADLYDPEAKTVLSEVYQHIFNCEMKLNHPVAARAALAMAYRLQPVEELRQGLDNVFGEKNPNLPAAARQEYQFLPLPVGAPAPRKIAWEKALAGAATGKLADVVRAFEQLSADAPDDPAALYNLALAQGWSGNNLAAVEALERYLPLEADDTRAASAWALAEVLKCGQGMEDHADYVEHTVILPLQQPEGFARSLEKLATDGLVGGLALSEDRTTLTGVVVEKPPPALTPELEAKQNPKLGAFFVCMGPLIRFWHLQKESLDKAVETLRPFLGQTGEPIVARGPAKFIDLFSETLIFTNKSLTPEARQLLFQETMQQFFEEKWLHRPLKALSQTPPVDATGHPVLRKKLRGVIDFLRQCAALGSLSYDFDRLRRKLGLLAGAPAAGTSQTLDVTALGAAELAGLDRATLPDDQLELAYQAALKLDAKDLAGQFAQALVQRPSRPDKPDRYVWFNYLITKALNQGEGGEALDWLNEGEKADCEHNEGRRRNDYELRRGQVLAKGGEFGQAASAFDRLVQRAPTELRYFGAAAEAMLTCRQGAQAQTFAAQGLAEARKQNNRDQEGYFQELAAAAKKQS